MKPEGHRGMRVACFGFSFIDYTIQIANALSQRGIDTFILLPDEHMEEHLDSIGERVRRYIYKQPRLYSPANVLLVRRLLRQLSAFNPDIIHIQGGHPWFSLALPWLRLKRRHIVSTLHDARPHLGENHLRTKFTMVLTRKYSGRIFVHGRNIKELMAQYYPANKIHVIPIGEYNVAPLRKYATGLKEEGNLVLFFGRIYQYKGLEYLIRAEPLITNEVPGAKIVIAGRGESFERYQRMMVNRENFIVHNHYISFKQGAELFERCSLVVLPYIEASQSGVVTAAYGFKKPVVITDVGSLTEVVDDGVTGYVVPPGDEVALARAVIKLLKDEALRKEMGENGYRKLKKDLSWDEIAEKSIQVYQEVLDGNR